MPGHSFTCRSEALTKAFLLTPRDTDVSWSLRDSEAGRLADDLPNKIPEKTMKIRLLLVLAREGISVLSSKRSLADTVPHRCDSENQL